LSVNGDLTQSSVVRAVLVVVGSALLIGTATWGIRQAVRFEIFIAEGPRFTSVQGDMHVYRIELLETEMRRIQQQIDRIEHKVWPAGNEPSLRPYADKPLDHPMTVGGGFKIKTEGG
jgi:hypothetical protein